MPTLKETFAKRFEIGTAVGGTLPGDYTEAELRTLRSEFTNVTPENCMKPQPIHPAEDEWDFAMGDALVQFAAANKLNVTGHCLVWHQQCPDWIFKSGSATVSRDLVLERTKRHIENLTSHYRGKIQGWDVVNEALDDGPGYIRQSLWTRCVGEDYVAKAFEFARAADPAVKLYYNDYNIELPEKRTKAVRLLKDLLARGLKVDAVGIQGHWILDRVPFEHIDVAISEFAALGLKVMITELDIDVVERSAPGADITAKDASAGDPYANGLPADVAARQAEQYAKLFQLFLKHQKAISRVTFWCLHDGRSWLNYWPRPRTNHPLLFDRQCRPKVAHRAVTAL